MTRTVSDVAKLTESSREQVKTWAWTFREWFSKEANPPKGQVRQFTDDDSLTMVFIACSSAEGASVDEIGEFIDRDYHREPKYREHLYCHTPLLQEPPDGLDETWRHGCLYTPSFFTPFELARNYRWCADQLLDMAIKQDAALDLRSPVLFAYRHARELYLKTLGQVEEQTHSLGRCLTAVEGRIGGKMRNPHKSWILEFDAIDPGGTSFRYNEDDRPASFGEETWIDYHHLKFVMDKLLGDIDMAILNDRSLWEENPRV
jgi:DNA-binding transcriptional MerR regulator